jgi:hypothetical protein
MKSRNRNAQYRIVDGQRERFCTVCATWKTHQHPTFSLCSAKPFGLQTTCAVCLLAQSKAHHQRKEAHYRAQREYARAAIAGKLAA